MTRFDYHFSKTVRHSYYAEKTHKKHVSDLATILIKTTVAQGSEYLTFAHGCYVFSCPQNTLLTVL